MPSRLVDDSGHYAACLDQALDDARLRGFRAEQAAAPGRPARTPLGIGIGLYNELTGLGRAAVGRAPDGRSAPATTPAPCGSTPTARVTVFSGVTSQGQGLETTVAQIVADALGVALRRRRRPDRRHRRVPLGVRRVLLPAGGHRRRRRPPRTASTSGGKALALAAGAHRGRPSTDLRPRRRRGLRRPGSGKPIDLAGRGRAGRLPGVEPAARGDRAGPGGHEVLRPDPRRLRGRGPARRAARSTPPPARSDPELGVRRGRRAHRPPADRRRPDRRLDRPGHRRRAVRAPRLRRGRQPHHRHAARLPHADLRPRSPS